MRYAKVVFSASLSGVLSLGFVFNGAALANNYYQSVSGANLKSDLDELFEVYGTQGPQALAEALSLEIFNQNRKASEAFFLTKLKSLPKLASVQVSEKSDDLINVSLGNDTVEVGVINAEDNLISINGAKLRLTQPQNPEKIYAEIEAVLGKNISWSDSILNLLLKDAHALTGLQIGIGVAVVAVAGYLLYRNHKKKKLKQEKEAAAKAAKVEANKAVDKAYLQSKKEFDAARGAWEGKCGIYPEGTEHRNFKDADKAKYTANIKAATAEINSRPCPEGSPGSRTDASVPTTH